MLDSRYSERHTDKVSISPTLFNARLFLRKFCVKLFCTYILVLNFFWRKNIIANLLIKCWSNWPKEVWITLSRHSYFLLVLMRIKKCYFVIHHFRQQNLINLMNLSSENVKIVPSIFFFYVLFGICFEMSLLGVFSNRLIFWMTIYSTFLWHAMAINSFQATHTNYTFAAVIRHEWVVFSRFFAFFRTGMSSIYF